MSKKCVICNQEIAEEYDKLQGTIIKVKDENSKSQMYYVCSKCQKDKDWLNKARVRAV